MTASTARQPLAATPDAAAGTLPGQARLSPIVAIFLIGLVIPFVFQVGPLRFSVYRMELFVAILPFLAMWIMGKAGRIRLPDIALLLMCFWMTLSYGVVHGVATAIETGGIIFIETMGAYLLGRLFVRTPNDLYRVVRLLFWIIVALLPLALVEAVTGRSVALNLFRAVFTSFSTLTMDPRWGLRRVQSVFEHPILFGVFCSSMIALVYYVLGHGRSLIRRLAQAGAILLAGGLSLSSGPMTVMGAQIGLIGWDRALQTVRARWQILAGMVVSGVVLIELLSNRNPIQILISFVAFRTSSAWNRLRIWEYGSASVMKHPLFGVGRNDWERAPFMPSSIDMFWLVPAVKNGLLPALLLQVAFFGVFLAVIFRKGLGARAADYRTGYLISLMGLYLAGWTVHYWNSVYVLLIFLLGCGYCFFNETEAGGGAVSAAPRQPAGQGTATRSRAPALSLPETPDAPLAETGSGARAPLRYSRQVRPHKRQDGT